MNTVNDFDEFFLIFDDMILYLSGSYAFRLSTFSTTIFPIQSFTEIFTQNGFLECLDLNLNSILNFEAIVL